jgi:hypothetical protein
MVIIVSCRLSDGDRHRRPRAPRRRRKDVNDPQQKLDWPHHGC